LPFARGGSKAGDASSGVDAGTFAGRNDPDLHPDVAVYDPANDLWYINVRYDTPLITGLGGGITFRGTPSVTTYTEGTGGYFQGFGSCWEAQSVPGSNFDQGLSGLVFTFTFTSVGPGRATNVHGASDNSFVTDYPVHGTLHVTCSPDSNSNAHGTVTVDTSF
jgi:hypothetical protein